MDALSAGWRAEAARRIVAERALSFAASVIKSGEAWSPTCDEIIGGALGGKGGARR